MAERATFPMNSPRYRQFAHSMIDKVPDNWEVVFRPKRRSTDQNALLHAIISDIAEQVVWKGQTFDVTTWKRLCVASWLREEGEQPEMIPALDGKGFDVIFERTSELDTQQCSALVDWCYSFGAQNGVTFKEKPT